METKLMKEQVETAPGQWEARDVPVPVPDSGEMLLKVRVYAIGAGEPSPGHGFYGTVEEIGSDVQDFLVGDRVAACVSPEKCFSQYVVVPASQCYGLSEEMDDYTAAFVAPLAHVLRSAPAEEAELAKPCIVRSAHSLRTALARARGLAPVISVVDNKKQGEAALKMGADYVIDTTACDDVDAEVRRILGDRQPVYTVAGDHLPHVDEPQAGWEEAVTLLRYHRVDPKPLFSIAVPPKNLPDAFRELEAEAGPVSIFIDSSLQTTFTFPGYREPMSATIAP